MPLRVLMVCIAAVLYGTVYVEYCSPTSDSTILSSMTTGADLIDHVKTQFVPASVAVLPLTHLEKSLFYMTKNLALADSLITVDR